MTATLLLVFLVGVALGFYIGRARAEFGRAWADGWRPWKTRAAYRKK